MREEVHDSMTRLLQFAREATASARDPVRDWADLLARLNVTAGVFSNWKRRGISLDGAVTAERAFGCYASWLLDGEGAASPLPIDITDAIRRMRPEDREHFIGVARAMLKITPRESGEGLHAKDRTTAVHPAAA